MTSGPRDYKINCQGIKTNRAPSVQNHHLMCKALKICISGIRCVCIKQRVREILKLKVFRVNPFIPKVKIMLLTKCSGWEEDRKVVRYLSMSKLYTSYKTDELYTSHTGMQLKLLAISEAELIQIQNTMNRENNQQTKRSLVVSYKSTHPLLIKAMEQGNTLSFFNKCIYI